MFTKFLKTDANDDLIKWAIKDYFEQKHKAVVEQTSAVETDVSKPVEQVYENVIPFRLQRETKNPVYRVRFKKFGSPHMGSKMFHELADARRFFSSLKQDCTFVDIYDTTTNFLILDFGG